MHECPPNDFSGGAQPQPVLVFIMWVRWLFGFEITLQKASRTKIKILDVLAYGRRLLCWDQGKRMEQFEHRKVVCQKRNMKRMRTVFFGTASNVSYSATRGSRHPDFQYATSTSSVDLIILKRFWLDLQPAHSASCPPV